MDKIINIIHSCQEDELPQNAIQDLLFLLKSLVCGETIDLELERKAMDSFLKMFLKINLSDHIEILRSMVQMLRMRVNDKGMLVQCKICDTLIVLIQGEESKIKEKYGKWKEIITNELVCVQLYEALEEMVSISASSDVTNKKLATTITLISVILNSNSYQRKKFHEVYGIKKMREILFSKQQMDLEVALALFELLTTMNPQRIAIEQRLISMKKLANVMIDVLPSFNAEGQEKLCESLRVMCVSVPQNRYICCKIGLISNIIQLLQYTQSNLASNIKSCLISLMEIIGCLSISASELKMLIGLFQTVEFSQADRLVQSLERMSSQNSLYQPSHFINFYNIYKNTYVQCPSIQRWNGSGVSIHMWICLDFKLPNNIDCKSLKVKHMLYSFLNSDGGGFESFFTHDGFLVLTVHSKKKFMSVTCTSSPFIDQEWHGLSIIYSRKLLSKDSVIIYVDGHEIEHQQLQFPVLNKEIVVGGLGCSARYLAQLFNIAVPKCPTYDLQIMEWGSTTILKGQLASFTLFNESLSHERIQDLVKAGPNSQLYFSIKESMAEVADASLMFNSVVLYYNAKAAIKNQLTDLNQAFKDKKIITSNMNASICRMFKIQETIQSIGGLSVLFPLLEQASFRPKRNSLLSPVTVDVTSFSFTEKECSCNSKNASASKSSFEIKVMNQSLSLDNESFSDKLTNINSSCANPKCENDLCENLLDIDSIVLNEDKVNNMTKHNKTFNSESTSKVDIFDNDESNIDLPKPPTSIQSMTDCEEFQIMEYNKSLKKNLMEESQLNVNSDDWTLLDPKEPYTQSNTYRNWLKENNYELNGVAHFISLIRHMIGGRKNAALLEQQGVRVIGYLLQKCDPLLINIGFLEGLNQLVETLLGVNQALLENVYQYILFDFNIWHRANGSVQIAHIQLIHNYIKENPISFSNLFGVEYFIRVIELYYGSVRVNQEKCLLTDQGDLRKSLLGLVKYLMKLVPSKENVALAVSYMSCVSNSECLDEVLDLVYNLVKNSTEVSVPLCTYLADSGCYIMYRWLVHDILNETRSKILNIYIYMMKFGKLSEKLKQKIVLKDLFPAIGELLCKQEVTRDVVLLLLKLGVSVSLTEEMKNDIFFNYQIILSVLRICQSLPIFIKLEVAIKVNHSLKLYPQSAVNCANIFAWYEPIWILIVASSSDASTVIQEEDLVFITIDIIHSVMWNGVNGSDLQAWTKRTEPITCLHELSSRFTFIQSTLKIERQLYEKCLLTAAMALKGSVQLYVVDSQNAEQMLKLVEDFLTSFEFTGDDSEKWSVLLIQNIFVLLDAMGAWQDSTESGNEWPEVLQTTERLLYLAFQQTSSKEILETASSRLSQLLHKRKLPSFAEVCYQVYHLHDVLVVLQKNGSYVVYISIIIFLFDIIEKFCIILRYLVT